MADVRRGLIIVNTGPGKGKTTAAMGTALRAVGNGMRVLMLQFIKGSWHYGELDAVKSFGDKFVMKQMGRGFVKVGAEKPDPEDVRMVEEAKAGAATFSEQKAQEAISSAQTILAKAEAAAKADRDRLITELKSEFGRMVALTTSQVTGKVLTADDQKRINEDALAKVEG